MRSLKRGSLRDVEAFQDGFAALPAEGIARVWVDVARLSKDLGDVVAQASSNIDLGLDWLSASVSAEDDGALVSMGMRTPGGGDTSYEPELFDRVPADAVAAVSFGGTQSTLDRIERSVDVDKLSSRIEKVTGVSLDGLVHALSRRGRALRQEGGERPRGDARPRAAGRRRDLGGRRTAWRRRWRRNPAARSGRPRRTGSR